MSQLRIAGFRYMLAISALLSVVSYQFQTGDPLLSEDSKSLPTSVPTSVDGFFNNGTRDGNTVGPGSEDYGPVLDDTSLSDFTNSESEAIFHVLAAEISASREDSLAAIDHYLGAASVSDDKQILRLATVNAARAGQTAEALEVARDWVRIQPDSLEARQYLALLLLRADLFDQSADELNEIRLRVEADLAEANEADHTASASSANSDSILTAAKSAHPGGEGEKFIAKMLELESHHQQALLAFVSYIKNHGYKTKQHHHVNHGHVIKNNRLPETNKNESGFVLSGSSIFGKKRFDEKGYELQQLTLADLALKAEKPAIAENALANLESAQALQLRATALNILGRHEQAVRLLRPLVSSDSAGDSLKLEFIKLLVNAGYKDEATRLLSLIVEKHPQNRDLLSSLIVLNIDQSRWTEAEQLSLRLSEQGDYVSEANQYLGEIYEARNEIDKAIAAYQGITDNKQLETSRQRIPVLLAKQKGLPAARLWLHKQRVKLKGRQQQALLSKIEADLLLSNNSADTALEHYQRALVLDPQNMDLRFSRALLYEQQGKINLAERDFLSILRTDANDKTALHALGGLLSRNTHRFDEALTFVNKAHALDPGDANIIDTLGWLHYRRGDARKAEVYLRRAFRQSQQPQIANHLIEVLQAQGQMNEARLILMKMRRLYPQDPLLKKMDEQFKKKTRQDS